MKKTKVILTVSLLVNVLLMGTIGGMAYKMSEGMRADFHAMRESLAPETRDLMKKTFMEKRKKIFAMKKEVRQRKNHLEEVMGAENFDPVVFDLAAKEFIDLNYKMSLDKIETTRELSEKLPQAEREKLAKFFVDVLTQDQHRGRKHRMDDDRAGPPRPPMDDHDKKMENENEDDDHHKD